MKICRVRAGKGASERTRRRYKAQLEALASRAYGGIWKVSLEEPGCIVLRDTTVRPSVAAVRENALSCCAVRRYGQISGGVARDITLGRTVPWDCVNLTWRYLKGPIAQRPSCNYANLFMWAGVDVMQRFHFVLRCMSHRWIKADWPQHGELWVRFGVDGVPRWSISYITMTMSFVGQHQDFSLHSVDRFAHCAVLLGTETVDSVTALLEASNMNDHLQALDGSMLQVDGQFFSPLLEI